MNKYIDLSYKMPDEEWLKMINWLYDERKNKTIQWDWALYSYLTVKFYSEEDIIMFKLKFTIND